MADQDMEQQDFTEDYSGGGFQDQNGAENGEGASAQMEAVGEGAVAESAADDSGAADAPGRDDDRKLFCGGLSWESTEKELREHFGKYGEIESINLKTDPNTGRSRGFAFLVFKEAASIDKVMEAGEHTINGKKVDPKKAKARHGKIFVGGLKPEITDEEVKEFFGKFGTIIEVEMPFDKVKNARKGFCFITYEQEAVVTELLKTPKQTIKEIELDVKKATPKPDAMGMGMMRGGRGGRGMRGGRGRGRGGGGGGWNQGWNQGYGYGQGYGGYGYGYGDYGYGYGGYGGYGGYDGYNYGAYGGYGSYGGGGQGYQKSQRGRQGARHQPY